MDGLFTGVLNGASTIVANDAPVRIGNIYTNIYPLQSHLEAALIWNRELTETEHASVYSELAENGGPSS